MLRKGVQRILEETRADSAALVDGDKSLIVYFGTGLTVGQACASLL